MTAEVIAKIEEIYERLPKIECRGKCANSCGPIDMSDVERTRIAERGVNIPEFSQARAQAWAADEQWPACPALGAYKQCTVYDIRPLICRLWGVAEAMPCPYGCQPERMLTDEEGFELIMAVIELGGSTKLDVNERMKAFMRLALSDETMGPLMRRYMRGDKSVEGELYLGLQERRDALP